jgi:hypothetical protein
VPRAPSYSPRLDRDLISMLYHTAKRRRVPMTKLASALVGAGLARRASINFNFSPQLEP